MSDQSIPLDNLSNDTEDYMVCNYVDRSVLGFSDSLVFNKSVKFLVSTTATLNFIKKSSLRDNVVYESTARIAVVDVLGCQLYTQGLVKIVVYIGSQSYIIEFHVLAEGFSIPEAGILGSPFLTKHQVVLNFAKKKMILLKPNKVPVLEPDYVFPVIEGLNMPIKAYCFFKAI